MQAADPCNISRLIKNVQASSRQISLFDAPDFSTSAEKASRLDHICANTLIIGDNRSVLNGLLLAGRENSIKIVYMDPPYNTRSAKSYEDSVLSGVWLENARHVLLQVHELLREDGLVFISIDDSEYAGLKLACDDIFGKGNFAGTFITRQSQRSNSRLINTVHEYVLCYAKNRNLQKRFSIKRMDVPEQREMILAMERDVKNALRKSRKDAERKLRELILAYCEKYDISWLKNYNCLDEAGNIYFPSDLSVPGQPRRVDIAEINLHLAPLKTRSWSSEKKFVELH